MATKKTTPKKAASSEKRDGDEDQPYQCGIQVQIFCDSAAYTGDHFLAVAFVQFFHNSFLRFHVLPVPLHPAAVCFLTLKLLYRRNLKEKGKKH